MLVVEEHETDGNNAEDEGENACRAKTCHENVDESPAYSRAQYTPKRDGGDGNYRQLNYYKQHAKRILRKTCLKNARARGTLPSKRSLDKYQFTADELRGLV